MKFLTWLFSFIFIIFSTFFLLLTISRFSIVNSDSLKTIVRDSGLYTLTEKILKSNFLNSDFEGISSKESSLALSQTFSEYNFQPIFENLIDTFTNDITTTQTAVPLVVDLTGFKLLLNQNLDQKLSSEIPVELLNIPDEWRVDSTAWSNFCSLFRIYYQYYPYLVLILII